MTKRAIAISLLFGITACSGSAGSAGKNGTDGVDGMDGAKGATGANGMSGAKGADGAMGAVGAKGADGANGATGADGATGATGTTGAPGMDGNDIILSETARTGLKISDVAVDLTGLDADQIESVGRGSYLVNAIADCKGCHNAPTGEFLAGNNPFPIGLFDPNSPTTDCVATPGSCVAGIVFTRNLTPHATNGLKLTEDQFVEALRTGKDFKNTATMLVMPWAQLRWLSDQDLHDIYHYLRQIPAVDIAVQPDMKPIFAPPPSPFANDVPVFADGDTDRPLPAAFDPAVMHPTAAAGEKFDTDNVLRGLAISPLADDGAVANMSSADEALYGRGSYIVNGPALCNECHTVGGRNQQDQTVKVADFLAGGQAFAVPGPLQPMLKQVRTMSGNLTGKDHGFGSIRGSNARKPDFAGFLDSLLSGTSITKPTRHPLGFPMPFDVFRNMTTRDKLAVYTYISTIRQQQFITGDKEHQAPARYCTVATTATDCTGAGESCAPITINGDPTHECVGATCTEDADCGACQKCDVGVTNKCLAEDPASTCVTRSF